MAAPIEPRRIPRERLVLTEKLYLEGKSRQRIAKRICAEYGVSARTARKYIQRVEAKLAALPKPPPEAIALRAEAMLLETYRLARDSVKYVTFQDGVGPDTRKETKPVPAPEVGTMANIAVRLAELHGAAAPQRVDVTSKGEQVGALPDAELLARIAELERAGG